MTKEKFGVAADEEIMRKVDELVAECDDLEVSRSEIVEAILSAFVQSETNQVERVREIIIRKTKSHSLTNFNCCARISKQVIRYNNTNLTMMCEDFYDT